MDENPLSGSAAPPTIYGNSLTMRGAEPASNSSRCVNQPGGTRERADYPVHRQRFEDLGFSPEEAENLKVRATLMRSLKRIIEESGMTQARAAGLLGVTQPRVSDLVRGKIELFSIDTLVNMLAAAGQHVEVSVQPREHRAA